MDAIIKRNGSWTYHHVRDGITIEQLQAKYEDAKVVTRKAPSVNTMMKWSDDGIARATDGCRVEPDGICPHGHPSWILVLGFI